MDFQQSVRTCLQKYADFNGRASRPEFWWFVLFTFGVSIIAGMIFRGWISQLISLALFVPSIAVGSRRLHDIGKSGWLQLLNLIPVIGWAILIYWCAQPSGPANQYGGMPAEAPVVPLQPPGAV
ncbi:MAG: DUF805 domain-containing protein [Pseudomonadota bacterium]